MSTLEIKPGPTIIPPTVGRVVWYYSSAEHRLAMGAPLAAVIAKVHSDRLVNLVVIDDLGETFAARHVELVQDGDTIPVRGPHCEWMPYQLGQARAVRMTEREILDEDKVLMKEAIEHCALLAVTTRPVTRGHPQIDAPTISDAQRAIAAAIREFGQRMK